MSNRPKTKDAGWVGFSYAVSALLNSRLQRPSLAIADVSHMAVRNSPISSTVSCRLVVNQNDLSMVQENSAVQGRVGAREGPIPENSAVQCPEANVMNGSAFHANTFYVRAAAISLPAGLHSSQDASDMAADGPRVSATRRARHPLARAPRSRRCWSARPPTVRWWPSPGLGTAACRPP